VEVLAFLCVFLFIAHSTEQLPAQLVCWIQRCAIVRTRLLPVKALSLSQPWASLIAIGAKRIETRSWGTEYRGPLAIHASKGFAEKDRLLFYIPPYSADFARAGIRRAFDLPVGCVVAIVDLVSCARVSYQTPLPDRGTSEREYGDFELGRWLWHLDNVRQLSAPIAARGSLGLWDWPVQVDALHSVG
jgi:activating signal cointegrator 1